MWGEDPLPQSPLISRAMPDGDSAKAKPGGRTDAGDGGQAPSEAQPCMPCRGTGKVLATRDGEQVPVTCPWCEGTGQRIAGIETQAAWLKP